MIARELLQRVAEAEDRFLRSTFVAPVLRGAGVQVRVAGIAWQFAVTPADFEGWAVLQPRDHSRAEVVGAARLSHVREYLSLFPLARFILTERRSGGWWGLLADASDPRFRVEGLTPVLMAQDAQLFEAVRARWDGTRFLYEGKDPRRDPTVGAYLRESLAEGGPPEELRKRSLTRQELNAYEWQLLLAAEEKRDTTAERLREAVAHADGKFHSFIERKDAYAVTFTVDGRPHTTTVRKGDLSVMLAGICLSGEDEKFDLTSLVGVIREGQQGYVLPIGEGGMPEEVYREIHPPRRRRR